MVMVFKCASRAPKDTELARAKRQVPVHDRDAEANEGTGLLGERDGSDELVCVTGPVFACAIGIVTTCSPRKLTSRSASRHATIEPTHI